MSGSRVRPATALVAALGVTVLLALAAWVGLVALAPTGRAATAVATAPRMAPRADPAASGTGIPVPTATRAPSTSAPAASRTTAAAISSARSSTTSRRTTRRTTSTSRRTSSAAAARSVAATSADPGVSTDSSGFVLGSASFVPTSADATPTATTTQVGTREVRSGGGITDHLARDLVIALVVAVLLLVVGIVGLVRTRDVRHRFHRPSLGRHR